jgi:two-component system sensor histidine kinase RegB
MPLRDFVHGCLERFQLLRPEADLALNLPEDTARLVVRVPAGLRHALINLLNNAADASASQGSNAVELQIHCGQGWLELTVRDHGPGFAAADAPGTLGRSGKQGGLGLGLALAEATAERLDGELTAGNTGHGAQVRLRLPLAVIGAD